MVTREFFRRWREYRQLIRELKGYSDSELAELGMVRTACTRTAFDAAFGSALEGLRRSLGSARARRGRTTQLKNWLAFGKTTSPPSISAATARTQWRQTWRFHR